MSGAIHKLLLPSHKTDTQAYWNKHIAILRSTVYGVPYHLSTLSALLTERWIFFKAEPSRNNGLLLLQISSTSWQIIRVLADITGDEREWFSRQYAHNPASPVWAELGVTGFFDQMHEIFEMASFLRHPTSKLMTYNWVFHDTWPLEKADFITQATGTLRSIMHLAVNEFGLTAGWVGDTRKKNLHDTAMLQWVTTSSPEVS